LRLINGFGSGSSNTFLDLSDLLFIFLSLLDLSVLDFDLLNFLGVLLDLRLLKILRSDDIRWLESCRWMSDPALDVFQS